jgi:hypothetical protein
VKIGNVLMASIDTLEQKLAEVTKDRDQTIKAIDHWQGIVTRVNEEIEGYRKALELLHEEANKI